MSDKYGAIERDDDATWWIDQDAAQWAQSENEIQSFNELKELIDECCNDGARAQRKRKIRELEEYESCRNAIDSGYSEAASLSQ